MERPRDYIIRHFTILAAQNGQILNRTIRKYKKRIALNLVKLTGTSANGIIFGFMLATGFLSMWISNTASTIMMLPIVVTVINLIRQTVDNKKGLDLFSVSLMLGIAYSANIGGMATIIGTPPNVVFVGYAEQLLNIEIDFSK